MSITMAQENKQQSFFVKYKKWIIALGSIYLLPTILIICAVMGSIIYSYNSTYSNSYNGYILAGFKQGFKDAPRKNKDHLVSTPWSQYQVETFNLKEVMLSEQKEYLLQFSESERAVKLAEMKQQGMKLSSQKQLEGRFTNGLNFYADYVKQRVSRDKYNSDKEYHKALEQEAWQQGYSEGYREGVFALEFLDGALRSFKGR